MSWAEQSFELSEFDVQLMDGAGVEDRSSNTKWRVTEAWLHAPHNASVRVSLVVHVMLALGPGPVLEQKC